VYSHNIWILKPPLGGLAVVWRRIRLSSPAEAFGVGWLQSRDPFWITAQSKSPATLRVAKAI